MFDETYSTKPKEELSETLEMLNELDLDSIKDSRSTGVGEFLANKRKITAKSINILEQEIEEGLPAEISLKDLFAEEFTEIKEAGIEKKADESGVAGNEMGGDTGAGVEEFGSNNDMKEPEVMGVATNANEAPTEDTIDDINQSMSPEIPNVEDMDNLTGENLIDESERQQEKKVEQKVEEIAETIIDKGAEKATQIINEINTGTPPIDTEVPITPEIPGELDAENLTNLEMDGQPIDEATQSTPEGNASVELPQTTAYPASIKYPNGYTKLDDLLNENADLLNKISTIKFQEKHTATDKLLYNDYLGRFYGNTITIFSAFNNLQSLIDMDEDVNAKTANVNIINTIINELKEIIEPIDFNLE